MKSLVVAVGFVWADAGAAGARVRATANPNARSIRSMVCSPGEEAAGAGLPPTERSSLVGFTVSGVRSGHKGKPGRSPRERAGRAGFDGAPGGSGQPTN